MLTTPSVPRHAARLVSLGLAAGTARSRRGMRTERSCQATTSRTTLAAAAPKLNANGAPNSSASPPAKRPPIGAVPAKTVTYSDMTRPRSSSGTLFWIVTLMVLTINIDARPMKTTSTKAIAGMRTKPSAKASARKAAPPPTMRRTSGRWPVA